jgi:hypothetical protein
MKIIFLPLCALCLLVAGCTTAPRVEAPRPAGMLQARADAQKIPVRSFALNSVDQPFELKSEGNFLGGEKRLVFFPKQAREYLARDLRDYFESRFRIDANADVALTITLAQAQYYNSWHSNPMFLVPFVGIVTSIADGFQQTPTTFVVEAKASVATEHATVPEVSAFVRRTEMNIAFSAQTLDKAREIYQRQINEVRKELFERLDAQLLTLWEGDRLTPKASSPASNVASLASELARLDTALADGKISKDEHATLVAAVKAKYSAPTPQPAAPI